MQYRLRPHPDIPAPDIAIFAEVERRQRSQLLIRYRLTGDIGVIQMPRPSLPRRADELWRTTCFEAFVRRPGAEAYVEFNFAPSYAWAAYSFDRYREGMKIERPTNEPIIAVVRHEDVLIIDAYVDHPSAAAAIDLNVTAVIEETEGTKSYWALKHPPGAPDFHDPACFALELPSAA